MKPLHAECSREPQEGFYALPGKKSKPEANLHPKDSGSSMASFSFSVSIVEKLSTKTLSVSWSDARSGRCSEQIWRLGRARFDSRCVVSGKPIQRGEVVFRPQSDGIIHPATRHHMILASSVPDYSPESQTISGE
jgi:hypothetical protein